MSNKYYSKEFKYNVIEAYSNDNLTVEALCKRYQIAKVTFYNWVEKFEKDGLIGLEDLKAWSHYSQDLKEAAVKDYISGEFSQYEIVRKYQISSRSVLISWINKYNSHRDLEDMSKGWTSSMTKGRKTSWDERIQVVHYCLDNGKDYQKTADKYDASYQQVYQWVKKYEYGGDEALRDKRGRRKEEDGLTPEAKIRLEIKKLERENERLRAENLFLKKLEKIERRRK
jgi:transposase-like protein